MATGLAIDVPLAPPYHLTDAPSATTSESYLTPASPRHIPAPVSIPPRFDDRHAHASYASLGSAPNSQRSPRSQQQQQQPPPPPPPPMPSFVFPSRPSTSAPSSYSRASGRRPKSVADLQERSSLTPGTAASLPARPSRSPALPDFNFNPGASLPPTPSNTFLSPPQSPQSPRAIPIRPTVSGHKRGGSEFVGGSLRSGEAFTLMSTSPTKSESGLASPTLAPTTINRSPALPSGKTDEPPHGPPHGRRGHAHRRSAAISSHDLSAILQPTSPGSPARGNSAPSSPSGFNFGLPASFVPKTSAADRAVPDVTPDLDLASAAAAAETNPDGNNVPQPASVSSPVLTAADEQHHLTVASKPNNRARVGFSDTLEFIPRPLSLVSSDTSSTVTARPPAGSGGHSVSGSISSVISLNASVAAVVEREAISPLARSPSRSTVTESRPSTAGAVLDRAQSTSGDDAESASPRRRNSIPFFVPIPNPAEEARASVDAEAALPSPSRTPKRWSFFSLDPFISNGSITSPIRSAQFLGAPSSAKPVSLPLETGQSVAVASASQGAAGSSTVVKDGPNSNPVCSTKTVARKSSNKKKKKARSWGILTRKSKARRKSRRAPTPPPAVHQADFDDDGSIEAQPEHASTVHEGNEDFAVAVPTVLVTPSGSPAQPEDAPASWQPLPSPSLTVQDDESSFPMIDLDAALGPFNTPLPRNPEWEAAQRAGGLAKRQLHSAAGMTRFSGPGMHYSHRRAESAPEMPPFNWPGIPRFNSSTAMADVFEEEEEDLDTDDETKTDRQQATPKGANNKKAGSFSSASSTASTSSRCGAPSSERRPSIDIRVTSTDGEDNVSADKALDCSVAASDDATSSIALSRRGSGLSGLSDDDRTQPSVGLKSEYSASSLHDEVIAEEDANVFSFGVPDSGCDFAVESSSDSTIHSPGRLLKGKDLAPVDVSPLHLPTVTSLAPVSPYSMTPSSAFPSPRSPMSYDGNRVSTAPSSVAEDTFQSLLLGEPGPEVRLSSDIPSLTSSNSTMTRESAVPHAPPFASGTQPRPFLASRGDERPASFTSTAFGRRRSSLASLHRLISTSHGERSKLSIEVPLDNNSIVSGGESEKRIGKSSRTKRLSRMMQFWKPKSETTP
ncbi:hypothetical protein SPI_01319 [Niveomyces insectorum RCEF 264]|uniref:Cell wall proline rich protein n=1 Tax=Niveomyces insectorum RCEF 264 TaxID=1081102 RepID=A0A167YVI3_9HYPO|nr:hypothetical protein SPI_01319 [Niveomyces insectorum RCEF 264]